MDSDAREQIMRETYWSTLTEDDHDYGDLSGHVERLGYGNPSSEQLKAFFMAVEYGTFCSALKWGFGDTSIGDELYEMVTDDREETLMAMSKWARSVGVDIGKPSK